MMWSTMAEELKVANDSMTCFSRPWGVQKGIKERWFLNSE